MYETYTDPHTTPGYAPAPTTDPDVEAYVEEAFGKTLASAIMCGFPVASIFAIIMGSRGLSLVESAKNLAAMRGVAPSGKNIASMILGKIGKIAGIVMTAFWGFYVMILLIAVLASM